MGVKLLWTAATIFLITSAVAIPSADLVSAVLAVIGCILMWLDR